MMPRVLGTQLSPHMNAGKPPGDRDGDRDIGRNRRFYPTRSALSTYRGMVEGVFTLMRRARHGSGTVSRNTRPLYARFVTDGLRPMPLLAKCGNGLGRFRVF